MYKSLCTKDMEVGDIKLVPTPRFLRCNPIKCMCGCDIVDKSSILQGVIVMKHSHKVSVSFEYGLSCGYDIFSPEHSGSFL
jgi:hypothetical protein